MSKSLASMFIGKVLSLWLLLLILVTAINPHELVFGLSRPNDPGDPSSLTYHSTVSEVRLVFFASDEHNHAVAELQKDDFAVVDDEMVIRDFRSFTRADLINLDVIVLMDSSESVLPHFQQEIADVQQLISQWPWRPGDDVTVLSFSGMETRLVCSRDCRSSFTTERVYSLPNGGATPLFDTLQLAAKMLVQRAHPDVWRVIILFSDGDDTISKVSYRDALEKILASEVQIYAVDLSPPGQASNGSALLRRIADDSGGRCLHLREGAIGIFSGVIDDLHSARVVTYRLPKSGSDFHSIRILPTHNLKLQFRCRSGYYYRSSSAD
jgi:Ca-activated chloride channel homolog